MVVIKEGRPCCKPPQAEGAGRHTILGIAHSRNISCDAGGALLAGACKAGGVT